MELIGFGPSMMAEFAKMGASGLSSNTLGQVRCPPPELGPTPWGRDVVERLTTAGGMVVVTPPPPSWTPSAPGQVIV